MDSSHKKKEEVENFISEYDITLKEYLFFRWPILECVNLKLFSIKNKIKFNILMLYLIEILFHSLCIYSIGKKSVCI